MAKYEVEIIEKNGTCNNNLFEKIAKNGDVNPIKISELVGSDVTITGFAECHIETDNANFDIVYYNTDEYGFISSGSEVFKKSVITYIDEINEFKISEVKTKKGKTYKATPKILNKKEETTNKKEETTNNDLPF